MFYYCYLFFFFEMCLSIESRAAFRQPFNVIVYLFFFLFNFFFYCLFIFLFFVIFIIIIIILLLLLLLLLLFCLIRPIYPKHIDKDTKKERNSFGPIEAFRANEHDDRDHGFV